MRQLKSNNIQVYLLLYEEFLKDKKQCFRKIFRYLESEIQESKIEDSLQRGSYFKKVHSDQIASFVEKHEEVLSRFSDRFISWF